MMQRIFKISTSVFLFVFFSSAFLFAQTVNVAKYEQLLHAIRETRAASDKRVEQAVEQEKVREAWETGKLIDEHILLHKERADYGKQVIIRLAKDLETSETELNYMLEFAAEYPIPPAPGELSWAHYRELLVLNDAKERDEISKEARSKKWSQKQLRSEIKKRKFPAHKAPKKEKLPHVIPGKLHTYRIVKAAHGIYKGELVVDLGFSSYYKTEQEFLFKEGDLIRCKMPDAGSKKENGFKPVSCILDPESKSFDLYTYAADVIQVVDGDTFHASFDLGFGFTMTHRVRLLRVDAPEILTSAGKESKAALEKLLAKNKGRVLIKSAEVDQHGRPLALVWAGDTLIDQALLEKDLAVLVQE